MNPETYNPIDRVLVGVGESLDSVRLSYRYHLEASLGKPITLPPTLDAKLCDADTIDTVANDLCALFELILDEPVEYVTGFTSYGEHCLTSDFSYAIFYPKRKGDPYYCLDCFVVVDCYRVYRVDSVVETGFLDWNLGYWLSPLRDGQDASLLDTYNEILSAGYSSSPYHELETIMISGWWALPPGRPRHYVKAALWVESRQSYVCRVAGVPYLCKVEPIPPCYG